jgi:hypothetical protein
MRTLHYDEGVAVLRDLNTRIRAQRQQGMLSEAEAERTFWGPRRRRLEAERAEAEWYRRTPASSGPWPGIQGENS